MSPNFLFSEHANAEVRKDGAKVNPTATDKVHQIVLRQSCSVQDIQAWLRETFFFVRLQKKPVSLCGSPFQL